MASAFSFTTKNIRINQTRSQRSLRAVILLMIASGLISACVFRLAQLQLVEGRHNRQLAEENRIRPVPIVADRGNILDRKGNALAANRVTRSVYLYPRTQTREQWQVTADRLSQALELPKEEILKPLEKVGYRSALPVRIYRDLTPKKFIALAEGGQIPGLEIQSEASRSYPYGSLAAHVLGYIGEATAEQLKKNPDFPMGMLLGQMGIERIVDPILRGTWGSRLIEVDAAGKELRMLGVRQPVPGSLVRLTLDLKLQQAAEKALNNRRGAVVAIDAKTGAVLVIASGPTFDPNLFTRKISQKDWDKLQSQDKPFLNRALQGYPPASTFKIITSAAAMQSGKFTPDSTVATAGAITVGGIAFHEHGGGGYGVIGFPTALAVSSNTFFYQVGMAIGPEEISKWGHRMGVGETSTMDLEGGTQGAIPTPGEKEKLYKEPWYAGDTVSMSIGQGLVQMTPLEMAVMIATIANNGWRVKPHLLVAQTNTPAAQREQTGLKPSTIETIRKGLIQVVQEGTGRQLNDGSIPPTAGKTGTAEVPGGGDTNALYVGYGPLNDPQIALAVVVENGGYGAESAVPIAHEVYKAYFGAKPTPAQPQPPR